jgi:3-methylfumaryl-CoA hydratase
VSQHEPSPISGFEPEALETWRGHIGRQDIRREVCDVEALRKFAAATGAATSVETDWPALGHWAFFLDAPPLGGLGVDGHPARGDGVLPAITLPRRMFAAGVIEFTSPLELGTAAQLTSTLADVKARTGSAGDLVFVELDRVITQAERVRVRERRTLVYRGPGETKRAAPASRDPGAALETWTPTEVELFRFSAATFNAHRIHYDRDYAQCEEGYPDLVVHGPFTAAKLCGLAGRRAPDKAMRRFAFRATAPLFVHETIRLLEGDLAGELRALGPDGRVAMTATAEFVAT